VNDNIELKAGYVIDLSERDDPPVKVMEAKPIGG
jgi:hypothetical protein